MKEVLSRRFKRLEKNGNNFPDLVVIDGGKGQLSSAIKEIEKYEDCNTKILSLVKGPDRNSKYDDVLYLYDGKIIRIYPNGIDVEVSGTIIKLKKTKPNFYVGSMAGLEFFVKT